VSTPLRQRDGIDDSLLYAPRRVRRSSSETPLVATAPHPSLVAGAPPTVPDISQSRLATSATTDGPSQVAGGSNLGLPRRRRRVFEGDVAIKDLRDRLSKDPDLVPQPPAAPSARDSVWSWIGRWLLILVLAAAAGFGIRLLAVPGDARKMAGSIVGAVATPGDARSSRPEGPMARLKIEKHRAFANEPVALGIAIDNGVGDEVVTLIGLSPGTRLSAGSPSRQGGWQISSRDLGAASAHAPAGFVGVMEAAVDLRSGHDRLMDSQVVRLEWLAKTAPAPTPTAAKPAANSAVQPVTDAEVASLIRRGQDFLKAGDVPSARIALRRAAQSDSPQAALAFGATFDPLLLAENGVIGLVPDAAQARSWYTRAAELGSAEAARRLERLAGM
jgi:hypothetical protein